MNKPAQILKKIWSYRRPAFRGIALALRLFAKSFRDLWMDGGLTQAAAISYYLVVSIFPLLLLLIGIAGFFLEPQDIKDEVIGWLSQYFPTGTRMVFSDNIQDIIDARGPTSVLGFVVLMWSCTLLFDAINQAVNAAFGLRGNARFLTDKFKSLVLILVIVIVALSSAYMTTHSFLVSEFESRLAQYPSMAWALDLGREAVATIGILIPIFLSVGAFGLAYRLLPRVHISIRDVWPAAIVTAILWELSKRGFVWYMSDHTEYREIYGSISAVFILMVWAYVSSLTLAWGAELTAEIWKERRKTQSAEEKGFSPEELF